MTVLLVLATFAIFLTIDYVHSRRHAVQPVARPEPLPSPPPPRPRPAFVGGFEFRDNLRYHPGHTWALRESPSLVRIGFDDFAARVMGKIESIVLPKRGQWIRQGHKIVTVLRNGAKAELPSPIEGEVTNVNDAAVADATLSRHDPYGDG